MSLTTTTVRPETEIANPFGKFHPADGSKYLHLKERHKYTLAYFHSFVHLFEGTEGTESIHFLHF